MKCIPLFLMGLLFSLALFSQTTIKMQREGGVSTIPCKVNGLNLSFIFDTGAADVSISQTEALFMLKNRYLSHEDLVGNPNYSNANGELTEGTMINLKEIEFAGLKLRNLRARVTKNLNAPLLLGQSAIAKLGAVQFDLANNTLTILNSRSDYDFGAEQYKSNVANPKQVSQVQNAAIPKDAPVNVKMTDFKNNVLNNEIVVFKSKANNKEYEGLTDSTGKFSTRLPAGDIYEIYVLGFKDSTSYNVLNIPATIGNAYYKKPFEVNIQHQAAKSFVLTDCNFETGKADLLPESSTVLDELVAYLVRKEDEKIEIGGHTDNVGTAKNNLVLSEARANTVRTYLLNKGIDPARVTAKGYGFSVPIASNKTAEGRAQNRRTEVKIL